MGFRPSLPLRLFPHPQRFDGAGVDGGGFCGGLETDDRRTVVRPQRDVAAGADGDPSPAGMAEGEAGRCAGLQLPASQRMGQGGDAHPEILHQTVHRTAGRHALHPRRVVPGRRGRTAVGKPRRAGADRTDRTGGVSERDLPGVSVRLDFGLEHPGFRAALSPESRRPDPDGPDKLPAVPQADRLGTADGGRLSGLGGLLGQRTATGIPFPEKLLFRGGRQGNELAGLALLGIAAGGIYRRKGDLCLEVG